jgi:hypothetical protein
MVVQEAKRCLEHRTPAKGSCKQQVEEDQKSGHEASASKAIGAGVPKLLRTYISPPCVLILDLELQD